MSGKISFNKSSLIFLLIFILIQCFITPNIYAISDSIIVDNLRNGKQNTFRTYISQLYDLLYKTKENRRNYETLQDYNKRIENSINKLNDFLQNQYQVYFIPIKIFMDWENSTIILQEDMPLSVYRKRGGNKISKQLKITVPVDPNNARLINTFPRSVSIDLTFNFDRNKNIIIDKMSIKYRENEIYAE